MCAVWMMQALDIATELLETLIFEALINEV